MLRCRAGQSYFSRIGTSTNNGSIIIFITSHWWWWWIDISVRSHWRRIIGTPPWNDIFVVLIGCGANEHVILIYEFDGWRNVEHKQSCIGQHIWWHSERRRRRIDGWTFMSDIGRNGWFVGGHGQCYDINVECVTVADAGSSNEHHATALSGVPIQLYLFCFVIVVYLFVNVL